MTGRINHLAVWIAAILYFVLGYGWYAVFGNPWVAAMGKSAAQMAGSPAIYAISFFLGLILAYATAIALARRPEDQTARQGVAFALFMGIAVYATQSLNHSLYEQVPLMVWSIDTGYVVVGFAMIGAIVGGFKRS